MMSPIRIRREIDMTERMITAYTRLFEIRLLHHYWLDDGETTFDRIANQAKKNTRLLKYDVRSFLTLVPTPGTAKALRGLGGVYRNTALGCVVAVPGSAVLAADTMFEIVVKVQNPDFFNYT